MAAGLGLRFHLFPATVCLEKEEVTLKHKDLAWKAEREELCVTVRMVRATSTHFVREGRRVKERAEAGTWTG